MELRSQLCFAVVGLALAVQRPARAVIFDVTGDPAYNTNAPAGAMADSGRQFEGRFGGFLGTAIAPHYFLTARHIGGDTNWGFYLDGTNYHPTAGYDDPAPGSDLRLWHVADRLPRYAAVYTGSNEVGAAVAVFGRGTQRGTEVVTDGVTNGWYWGASDGVLRWGSNRIEQVTNSGGAPYLYATFDHGAGPDECHLSSGDSGGGLFVMADGAWQLAGINWAVDGYFNTTNSDAGRFSAAIYDARGLYWGAGADWSYVTNHVASGFYASRVTEHYAWLTNTIPDFDSNADGLPDWWEERHSGDIHGMSPTNDPDHDGADNLAEWIARTDPTNPASRFRIAGFTHMNGAALLSFTGWSDRYYRIHSRETLATNGYWTLAVSNAIVGVDGTTTWTDTNLTDSVTARFYRVDVLLPQ